MALHRVVGVVHVTGGSTATTASESSAICCPTTPQRDRREQ